MKKIELATALGAIANLGVIAGIFFLIIEIQQSNQIATATAEIEIRGLFSEINGAYYAVPGMADLLVKATDSEAQLTPEEYERLFGFVQRITNAWAALEVAYDNRVVPSDSVTIIEDNVRRLLSKYPKVAPMLRDIYEGYTGQQGRRTYSIVMEALERTGD